MPSSAQASSSKVKPKATKSKALSTRPMAAVTDIDSIFSKPAKPVAGTKASSAKVGSVKGKERARDDTSKARASAADGLGAKAKLSDASGQLQKKKVKKAESAAVESEPIKAEVSRVVEVVDTSIPKTIPSEVVAPVKAKEKGKKRDKREADEDEMFADSRGTGPNLDSMLRADLAGRKTEEGFLIYKEAELDIDPEAGGTPLCPFDCECCF